jgi:hypothetical protein
MTDSSTWVARAVLDPTSELAAARAVYAALLGLLQDR